MIDFIQYLVRHFHSPEAVNFIYNRLGIVLNGADKFLQLFFNGIYLGHLRIGDGYGFGAVRRFYVKRKNILVFGPPSTGSPPFSSPENQS